MYTRKDYLTFSQECRRIADEVQSADLRDRLLRMAQAWAQLAAGEPFDADAADEPPDGEYDIDADPPH
jgi:hypothetical protein